MSEDMARALGTTDLEPIKIGDKECVPRPLSVTELMECERRCLKSFKREFLETWNENLDMIPEDQRLSMIARKIDEVGKWDASDLPHKYANNPSRIKLTDELRARVRDMLDITGDEDVSDFRMQRLAAALLDGGLLPTAVYKELTGTNPPQFKVDYVNWWITGSYEGMLTFVWVNVRHLGLTRDQVAEATRGNARLLIEVSRDIERLSAPKLGNG